MVGRQDAGIPAEASLAGAVAVVGITVLALIGAVLLSRRLTSRLTRLTRNMEVFRHETLETDTDATTADVQPLPSKRDEVDELRFTFDRMSARIEDQIVKLEDQDRLRRIQLRLRIYDIERNKFSFTNDLLRLFPILVFLFLFDGVRNIEDHVIGPVALVSGDRRWE